VIVFGSIPRRASQPPSLPPRSVSENSEPAGVKLNEPQLLTPTAPTLRASTFSKDAEPADPGADHRRARAVDLDVLEVHVRDRVQVLHREVADQHDRVVRVVEEVSPTTWMSASMFFSSA
jgi:hypothetical protein